MLTRRAALTATAAMVASAGVAGATASQHGDADLIGACRRWHEIRDRFAQQETELALLHGSLPSQVWDTEEQTLHRIGGDKRPRLVGLTDIENADRWDSPTYPTDKHSITDDGTTWVCKVTATRPAATEADLAAWRDRCAARRALFDAKMAAYRDARDRLKMGEKEAQMEALYQQAYALADTIRDLPAATMAGVLEKLRVFERDQCEYADEPPDDPKRVFLQTIVAEMERVSLFG